MSKQNIKYLVPNGITFLSLTGGVVSIIASMEGALILAAVLIFLSYWLDMIDGYFARKLNAQSEFGLQLDSLVDLVSLGVAPAILVFQHLRSEEVSLYFAAPFVVLLVLAGAFRLARFNMLPAKSSGSKDSVGLTITQSGGTLALAVLADNVHHAGLIPAGIYIPLLVLLAGLMVSTIPFPPSSWFFSAHKFGRPLLVILLLLVIVLPTFSTWFILYIIYIVVSTGRAIVNLIRPRLFT